MRHLAPRKCNLKFPQAPFHLAFSPRSAWPGSLRMTREFDSLLPPNPIISWTFHTNTFPEHIHINIRPALSSPASSLPCNFSPLSPILPNTSYFSDARGGRPPASKSVVVVQWSWSDPPQRSPSELGRPEHECQLVAGRRGSPGIGPVYI